MTPGAVGAAGAVGAVGAVGVVGAVGAVGAVGIGVTSRMAPRSMDKKGKTAEGPENAEKDQPSVKFGPG